MKEFHENYDTFLYFDILHKAKMQFFFIFCENKEKIHLFLNHICAHTHIMLLIFYQILFLQAKEYISY